MFCRRVIQAASMVSMLDSSSSMRTYCQSRWILACICVLLFGSTKAEEGICGDCLFYDGPCANEDILTCLANTQLNGQCSSTKWETLCVIAMLHPSACNYTCSDCQVENYGKFADAICDDYTYNNAACGYDGGDCCITTCTDEDTDESCPRHTADFDKYCIDPSGESQKKNCEAPVVLTLNSPGAELTCVYNDSINNSSVAIELLSYPMRKGTVCTMTCVNGTELEDSSDEQLLCTYNPQTNLSHWEGSANCVVKTPLPTSAPTSEPTSIPTPAPTNSPSPTPTFAPTAEPTEAPTNTPTDSPSVGITSAVVDEEPNNFFIGEILSIVLAGCLAIVCGVFFAFRIYMRRKRLQERSIKHLHRHERERLFDDDNMRQPERFIDPPRYDSDEEQSVVNAAEHSQSVSLSVRLQNVEMGIDTRRAGNLVLNMDKAEDLESSPETDLQVTNVQPKRAQATTHRISVASCADDDDAGNRAMGDEEETPRMRAVLLLTSDQSAGEDEFGSPVLKEQTFLSSLREPKDAAPTKSLADIRQAFRDRGASASVAEPAKPSGDLDSKSDGDEGEDDEEEDWVPRKPHTAHALVGANKGGLEAKSDRDTAAVPEAHPDTDTHSDDPLKPVPDQAPRELANALGLPPGQLFKSEKELLDALGCLVNPEHESPNNIGIPSQREPPSNVGGTLSPLDDISRTPSGTTVNTPRLDKPSPRHRDATQLPDVKDTPRETATPTGDSDSRLSTDSQKLGQNINVSDEPPETAPQSSLSDAAERGVDSSPSPYIDTSTPRKPRRDSE